MRPVLLLVLAFSLSVKDFDGNREASNDVDATTIHSLPMTLMHVYVRRAKFTTKPSFEVGKLPSFA